MLLFLDRTGGARVLEGKHDPTISAMLTLHMDHGNGVT